MLQRLIIFLQLFLMFSCYGQTDTEVINILYPQARIRDAYISDCNNPILTLAKSATNTVDYEVSAAVDCQYAQRALFVAGSTDTAPDKVISVRMQFNKDTLTFESLEVYQGAKKLNFEELESLAGI